MSQFSQEAVALGIVGITFGMILVQQYRKHLAAPFSQWLLNNGHVKLAVRVRGHAFVKKGCSGCKSC